MSAGRSAEAYLGGADGLDQLLAHAAEWTDLAEGRWKGAGLPTSLVATADAFGDEVQLRRAAAGPLQLGDVPPPVGDAYEAHRGR